ncbi:MAG: exodeoxyribonuclease III [Gemmatimonadota bacterium]
MSFKVATWNINSIKVRLDRVLSWLEREEPDALCLQETKIPDDQFPSEAVQEVGYHAVVHGQKAYNGVAILSRREPVAVERGLPGDDADAEARLIAANIGGVRVISAYFPNGQMVGTDRYQDKLRWMDRLREHLQSSHTLGQRLILAGDFNVAPTDADVAHPDRWGGSVLCHHEARRALARFEDWGLVDVVAAQRPQDNWFTWWDYQRLAFPKNDGLRIDHVFCTPPLARVVAEVRVDRDARKKLDFESKPSDHAPVIVRFKS